MKVIFMSEFNDTFTVYFNGKIVRKEGVFIADETLGSVFSKYDINVTSCKSNNVLKIVKKGKKVYETAFYVNKNQNYLLIYRNRGYFSYQIRIF